MVRPLLSQKARRPGSRSDTDEIAGMTCPRLPPRQPCAMVNAERGAFVSIQSNICHREHPMKSPQTPESGSVSFRLAKNDLALIDRAANTLGQSRAAFVRAVAKQAAEEVLHDDPHLSMSTEGFDAFMRAVSAPAAQVPEMVTSLCRKAPWDKEAIES